MNDKWDYTKEEFKRVLKDLGIKKGDIIFTHIAYAFLGKPEHCENNEQICQLILDSFLEILGEEGTLLVPTYTYSFCEKNDYDIKNSPSTVGPFTEFFRKQKNVIRSEDPIFSVAGIGSKSEELLSNLPHTCFGKNSIYDKLKKNHGKICMVGLQLRWATFRHHIEEMVNIPSRFIKKFDGKIIHNNKKTFQEWKYYVRHLNENCYPEGKKLEKMIREHNLCKISKIGRGEILCIESEKYFKFGFEQLKKDPWLTVKGPPIETSD